MLVPIRLLNILLLSHRTVENQKRAEQKRLWLWRRKALIIKYDWPMNKSQLTWFKCFRRTLMHLLHKESTSWNKLFIPNCTRRSTTANEKCIQRKTTVITLFMMTTYNILQNNRKTVRSRIYSKQYKDYPIGGSSLFCPLKLSKSTQCPGQYWLLGFIITWDSWWKEIPPF